MKIQNCELLFPLKETKTENQSLDDLMKALLSFVKNEHSKLTLDKVNNFAKRYNKKDVIEDVNQIYKGHLVIPHKDSLGLCAYQINKQIILKSGDSILVPQFILDENKWESDPGMCLAWFKN